MVENNTMNDEQTRESMLTVNERQKQFYETHGESDKKARKGLATRIWAKARRRCMQDYRRDIGLKQAVRDFQLNALGDLTGKRVLDLGCNDGNSMSVHLAKTSSSYLGVDLSESAIELLNDRIADIPNATGKAVDFLSSDFKPQPFDVIYAHSVMHHFEHFDAFLAILRSHLVPGGMVVTFDPLETAATLKLIRFLYRPFQEDADWEWPFRKSTFSTIEKHFHIDAIQGFLGRAKWPIFLTPIPGTRQLVKRLGVAASKYDYSHATDKNRALWSCIQVAMKLSRPVE